MDCPYGWRDTWVSHNGHVVQGGDQPRGVTPPQNWEEVEVMPEVVAGALYKIKKSLETQFLYGSRSCGLDISHSVKKDHEGEVCTSERSKIRGSIRM